MSEDTRFECRTCGFRSDRRDVRYDRLGYAICPVCATCHDPTTQRDAPTPIHQ